jgi:riboflavin kinase/FMN adenylyltransferase
VKIYRSLAELPADFGPSAITIGNFDGVHCGHRHILRRVAAVAAARGWRPGVLTFDPHPTCVVAPDRTPPLLTSPEERAQLMGEEGIEQVLILPFTREVAQLSPEDFARRLLAEALGARAVLVGDNFRFGHRQAGNVEVLAQLGRSLGFETEVVPAVSCRGRVVSSSAVRQLITEGNVSLAARFLGRPYAIGGNVVSGRGVGSKQTVPTLNLATAADVIPARGVYITRTQEAEGPRRWNSITNVGYRPTFGESGPLSIETFLLDEDFGPAGGTPQQGTPEHGTPEHGTPEHGTPEHIRVAFLRRVRDERRFETPEDLRAQILKDVRAARSYFRRTARWTHPQCISC